MTRKFIGIFKVSEDCVVKGAKKVVDLRKAVKKARLVGDWEKEEWVGCSLVATRDILEMDLKECIIKGKAEKSAKPWMEECFQYVEGVPYVLFRFYCRSDGNCPKSTREMCAGSQFCKKEEVK